MRLQRLWTAANSSGWSNNGWLSTRGSLEQGEPFLFPERFLIVFSFRHPFWYFGTRCEPTSITKQPFTKPSNSGAHQWYASLKILAKANPLKILVLIRKMLELSNSKTEHLPGLLPFVPGMPVILTQNIAIELGLINGVNGIFRQLVYQADSVTTDNLSEAYPSNTQYVHRPLYALIEIARSKIECNMEELPPKLVPIPLIEQTFRVDISDIHPKEKRTRSNHRAFLSVKRRALPLLPAYCITTHKSQGQTLSKVVIELKLPNEADDIAAVYVPLSRAKRLTDLVILRHFDYKVLLIKPSKSQVAEMERLDKLYSENRTPFVDWFYVLFSIT